MKASGPQLVIAGIVILGVLGLLIVESFFPIDDVVIQVEDMVLGAMIYAFKDVIGFFFKND